MFTSIAVANRPDTEQFWLIDYRIYSPDNDGKTKLDHVSDMLESLKKRNVSYLYLLVDSWYDTSNLFKNGFPIKI